MAMQPLERIVVGVDFTESSLAVAQWAGRHLAGSAALTLVHVIAMPMAPNASRRLPGLAFPAEGTLRARVRSFTGALRGLAGMIGGPETKVEVRVGDPAVELDAHAEALDADLIVIGGNPVFRGAPRVDARTTERLVRDLTRPVLIARNVQAAPTTVLAALATDPNQAVVLTTARTVAERTAARVTTLRLSASGHGGALQSVASASRTLGGVADAHHAVSKREQVRMILDVARELGADLIVVGKSATEDRDDVARMLARTASCSVLVVPLPGEPRPGRRFRLDTMPTTRRLRPPGQPPGSNDGSGPTRPAAVRPATDDAA